MMAFILFMAGSKLSQEATSMSTDVAENAVLIPPPAAADPTEGEQPGEVATVAKKTRAPKSRVKCKECGKVFDGPNMKTKLGAHAYHAHGGKKAAAKAAANANGSASTPDVAALFAPLRAAAVDVQTRATAIIKLIDGEQLCGWPKRGGPR